MLFFAGAGAVGVIRDHIIDNRRDAQLRAARRALRYRIVKRDEGWDPATQDAVQWESFPCFYLCLACGHLAHHDEDACPGCHSKSWVDLRNMDAAEHIRQMDRRHRREIPERIKGNANVIATVTSLATGALWVLWLRDIAGFDFDFIALSALLIGVVWVVTSQSVSRIWNYLSHRARRRYPARWKLPIPLPNTKTTIVQSEQGVPRTSAPLLEAPLTGRPCLGYEVSVHFDEIGDRRPPMWILEEERTLPMELGGLALESDRLTIELPVEQVAHHDGSLSEADLGRFLRQRGLFSSEGNYSVFEAIIEPERAYRIERHAGPNGAVPVIRPAEE